MATVQLMITGDVINNITDINYLRELVKVYRGALLTEHEQVGHMLAAHF